MSLATRKKKPTGKAVAQDLEEETQTFQGSEPLLTTETTPPRDTIDPPQEIEAPTRANRRTQLEQNVASALGAPVSLTDEQFRVLLERLAPANSPRTVADSHPLLRREPLQRAFLMTTLQRTPRTMDQITDRANQGDKRLVAPCVTTPLGKESVLQSMQSPLSQTTERIQPIPLGEHSYAVS